MKKFLLLSSVVAFAVSVQAQTNSNTNSLLNMANSILNSGSSAAVTTGSAIHTTGSSVVNSASTAISGTNSNANLLDNYKQAVTNYLSTSQKAKAGDTAAAQSLPGLSQKVQNLASQVKAAWASLSPEQKQQAQSMMTSMATSFLKK